MIWKTLKVTFFVIAAFLFVQPVRADETIDFTLLVMPREEIPLQIGFDCGRKGYPLILLSYESAKDGEFPVVHAWNGGSWVFVSEEAYRNGTFFMDGPGRGIVIGKNGEDAPWALTPSSTWCSRTVRFNSTEPRELLNFIGTALDFPFPHWQWFAKRYGFGVDEINPDGLNDRWYYHTGVDYLRRKGWLPPARAKEESVELPPAEDTFEPEVIEEETVKVIEVEEVIDDDASMTEDPFESEEIPPAEVVEETE